MNILDIVLLVILVAAAIQGLKIGLIGAAVNAAALIIGWMLAGQLSDEVGSIFSGSIASDTIVTVISYVVIMAVSLFVGRMAWKTIRPIVGLATLGMVSTVDRVGGVALGDSLKGPLRESAVALRGIGERWGGVLVRCARGLA